MAVVICDGELTPRDVPSVGDMQTVLNSVLRTTGCMTDPDLRRQIVSAFFDEAGRRGIAMSSDGGDEPLHEPRKYAEVHTLPHKTVDVSSMYYGGDVKYEKRPLLLSKWHMEAWPTSCP